MALSHDIVQKIKQLKIKTRRLLSGALLGNNRSTQKGTGLDFDQIRAYTLGDDVRFIDWGASARADTLLVKQYMQETTKSVMIVCDFSASMNYGSGPFLKSECLQEVASLLALTSVYENDAVGLVLCHEQGIKSFPPKQGMKYAHLIMEALYNRKASGAVDLEQGIDLCAKLCKQKSLIIVISDFFDAGYQKSIAALTKKHEVIALICRDHKEIHIPFLGYLRVKDPESSHAGFLATKDLKINAFLRNELEATELFFRKNNIAFLTLNFEKPWAEQLISFFTLQNMRYLRGM